jgi:hypothetical protein
MSADRSRLVSRWYDWMIWHLWARQPERDRLIERDGCVAKSHEKLS